MEAVQINMASSGCLIVRRNKHFKPIVMEQKLHFEIAIQASPEKVYQRLIDDQFYREWTEPFYPGSFYKGSWEKNSSIQFLAVDEDGQLQGIFQ